MRLRVLSAALWVIVLGAMQDATRGGPVLVFTEQSRSVEVEASVFTKEDRDSRSASGFGTFEESLTVHPILIVDGERYASQGNASQKSTLGPDGFAFSGSIYAQSIHPADSKALGRSRFDVSFDLTSPARYSLTGFMHNPNESPAAGKLQLLSGAGADAGGGEQVLFQTNAGPDAIDNSGDLVAGSYRLLLDAGGLGNSSAAGGGIDYNLSFSAAGSIEAVPLPPAVWPGAIVLAGAALASLRKKMRLRLR